MRIFYAASTSINKTIDSQIWRHNLYEPLVDLGHDVVEFDYDIQSFKYLDPGNPEHKTYIDENRPKLSEALLRQIKQAHEEKPVDLFFSYFYDAYVFPETIDAIRAMGITTVNWYCNGSYQLHLVSEISPHYDWCLVPEKFRLKDYAAMGARPIYSQEAANPNIYKPYNVPVEYDVTFVGQGYGERPAYIQYLRSQGIDVRVWGSKWEDYSEAAQKERKHDQPLVTPLVKKLAPRRIYPAVKRRVASVLKMQRDASLILNQTAVLPESILGGVLSDEEMIKMYSRSKINLGFSICGNTHKEEEPIMQVRLRDFEIPMSGGFYMVAYMDELEEFYDIGKEIVCYEGPQDLVEKIKYYLTHDAERERIRQAGRERCLKDHTWQKRFDTAFQKMGLNG